MMNFHLALEGGSGWFSTRPVYRLTFPHASPKSVALLCLLRAMVASKGERPGLLVDAQALSGMAENAATAAFGMRQGSVVASSESLPDANRITILPDSLSIITDTGILPWEVGSSWMTAVSTAAPGLSSDMTLEERALSTAAVAAMAALCRNVSQIRHLDFSFRCSVLSLGLTATIDSAQCRYPDINPMIALQRKLCWIELAGPAGIVHPAFHSELVIRSLNGHMYHAIANLALHILNMSEGCVQNVIAYLHAQRGDDEYADDFDRLTGHEQLEAAEAASDILCLTGRLRDAAMKLDEPQMQTILDLTSPNRAALQLPPYPRLTPVARRI